MNRTTVLAVFAARTVNEEIGQYCRCWVLPKDGVLSCSPVLSVPGEAMLKSELLRAIQVERGLQGFGCLFPTSVWGCGESGRVYVVITT